MAHVRGELNGGRPRGLVRLTVRLAGGGHHHHHRGANERQHSGGSG